ncbi:hypothetical protein Tco_0242117 [Tanacetum coccineum]
MRYKRWCYSLILAESNSLPHAHAQTTKTFYKHQDSRIMKAQELKTKTSTQTLIYKIFLQRYQDYQGRLLASFQDDAKYEHVGQDTRSQDMAPLPLRDQRHPFLSFRFDRAEEMQTAGFSLYWVESVRQIPDNAYLRDYWIRISSTRDFLGITSSYTSIRDPILRLCHRLIACSIAGRSQSPEKVTVTDLFYLREMDVGSVNVPYLLARYLRLFASGRKQGAMISGGQFLPVIDMNELARLQICIDIDYTWAWVAPGPENYPDAVAGALEAVEDAPIADEGALAIPKPIQAPQPSPPAAGPTWTIA